MGERTLRRQVIELMHALAFADELKAKEAYAVIDALKDGAKWDEAAAGKAAWRTQPSVDAAPPGLPFTVDDLSAAMYDDGCVRPPLTEHAQHVYARLAAQEKEHPA